MAEEEAEARALAAKKALADERELRELYPLSDICEKAISDLFRMIDTNDNKQIEYLEHKDVAKKLHSFTMPVARWKFENKDTDGDGKISVKEWRAAMHEIKVRSGEEHLLWAIIRSFWVANKRFVISKFKFKFPRAGNLEILGLVLGCIEAKFCK